MRKAWFGLLLIGWFVAAAGCGGQDTETPTHPVPPPSGPVGTVYDNDSPGEE